MKLYILFDNSTIIDWISDYKGKKIGEEYVGLNSSVQKYSIIQAFDYLLFQMDQIKKRKKKFVHVLTDGVAVSMISAEKCIPIPKC